MSAERRFEIEFFNVVFDQSIASVKEIFLKSNEHLSKWEFLYKIQNLPAEKEDLRKKCQQLQLNLTNG